MKQLSTLPILAFVTLGALWGFAFLAVNIGVTEGFNPVTFVFLRLTGSALIMVIILGFVIFMSPSYIKKPQLSKDLLSKMFLMAFFNNTVPFVSVAIASTRVNVGVVSILNSGIPIFSAIFAPLLIENEQLTRRRIMGIFTGFLGVIAVYLHALITDERDEVWLPGYFLVPLACASYGFASVFGKKYLQKVPGALAVTLQLSSSCIQVFVFASIYEAGIVGFFGYPALVLEQIRNASQPAIISVFYVAIFASCCAYGLYFYLLKTIGAVRQTLVGYMLPFFGLLAGITVRNEWEDVSFLFKFLQVFGAFLIISGVFVVQLERRNPETNTTINPLARVHNKELLLVHDLEVNKK
ncbi:hypothetical protein P9112_009754 [Eukaryota sp. TZLM1-RC]